MTESCVRAAVYLRQSLDATGEQLAVTRQREDCLKIARDRGWTVTEEYVDPSVSASDAKKNRPAYNRLVEDFNRGRFDALVCWDLDRLTRQPRQLEDWIDAAEGRGLRLVTANGEADLQTDGGRMYARIKAAVARGEVDRKSARQTRAQRQRAERGLPPAGVRLTGYTIKGELIPDEAELVAAMFDRFTAGDSLRGITTWLQDGGHQTRRGAAWNPSSVRTILTNARYAGRSVYKGTDTQQPGTWTPIVTPEQFAAAQSILNDPRRVTNHRGTHRQYLGSGLYLCGVCGLKVSSWSGHRYRCRNGCCARAGTLIDELVTAVTLDLLRDPRLRERLAKPQDSTRLAELTQKVKDDRDRLAVIEADYDAGHIDGRRYAVATEKVRAELQAAEREQVQLLTSTGPASVLGAPDPAEAFELAPLMIRQAVVNLLMEVRLMKNPPGRKGLPRESVVITPRVQP